MARKSTQDDSSDTGSRDDTVGYGMPTGGGSAGSTGGDAAPASNAGKRSSSRKYITIAIAVMAVAFIAYSLLSGVSGPSLNSRQVFNNVSSYNLNQTQSLFVKDLERSENVTSLEVSYHSSNATQYITQSSNLTMAINSNLTIDSYKLGNYNKTVITDTVTYTNSKSGAAIAKNVSSVYYYDTNATVTCFNDTTYSSELVTNSSLQCGSGDQGQNYIEETPYTAVNVSSLAYLVFNNTVTYSGAKSIAGSNCDDFIISNATSANLQSNYSVFNLCIDTHYGVPLYFNDTDVVKGVPSSFGLTATAVSASVSASEFVIPQQYLNAMPKSII
jgi:hypothetical protein